MESLLKATSAKVKRLYMVLITSSFQKFRVQNKMLKITAGADKCIRIFLKTDVPPFKLNNILYFS